jgi:hypothetical protein
VANGSFAHSKIFICLLKKYNKCHCMGASAWKSGSTIIQVNAGKEKAEKSEETDEHIM